MAEPPRNWQSSARGLATTVFIVAIALFFAVRLLESIATALVVIAVIVALALGAVALVRARKSRW